MDGPARTKDRAKSLRREMSPPEVILWQHVRGGRLEGLRFRRQHPIGRYVLDFYCDAAKLAVEVDGAQHFEDAAIAYDADRDAWCAEHGVETLRVTSLEVFTNIEGVLRGILDAARRRLSGRSGRRPARIRFAPGA
jgi:very-short-patch-repair endonuclease